MRNRLMNRKGSMIDFIVFGVVLMGILITLAIILLVNSGLNTGFQQMSQINPILNQSVQATWNPYYNGLLQNINFIALGFVFGEIFLLLITMFLVRIHPAFLGLYILLWIISIMFAVSLSNAFQEMETGAIGTALNAMPAALWIMNNLVMVTVILGIIGGILLFIEVNVIE